MPNLDDYLNGKPLTPELEALARGDDPDDAAEEGLQSNLVVMAGRGVERPIDDDDREHLRRLKLEPGWPILLRLLDNRIKRQEDACQAASKRDPFDKDLPAKWAAVGALEEARRAMVILLDAEVAATSKGEVE